MRVGRGQSLAEVLAGRYATLRQLILRRVRFQPLGVLGKGSTADSQYMTGSNTVRLERTGRR